MNPIMKNSPQCAWSCPLSQARLKQSSTPPAKAAFSRLKSQIANRKSQIFAALMLAALLPWRALAFPPAPDHVLYGMVRDEMGNPITLKSAVVYLETAAGVQIRAPIIPGLDAGVNYKLSVPMDSGLTSDKYKPTALRPAVPFKMWVLLNGVPYLPIEMNLKSSSLGQPAERTRIDLTLGEDLDGDGLPDAWERAMIAALGLNMSIEDFNPFDDSDNDGMSNLDEYLAGTYAFDPSDGFSLKVAGYDRGSIALEFMAIRGRSYTVLGSHDMIEWSPVAFQLSGSSGPLAHNYHASDVRPVRIDIPNPEHSTATFKFFKLMVR
jgi:hypothetical protein